MPPSALQAELVKQWFWYFAVNLAATSQAPRPTLLRLGADDPVSITPRTQRHERIFYRDVILDLGDSIRSSL